MKKMISVIMSTKDTEEKMLRQAIESILNQTYDFFEFIIICDGGKSDLDIVKSYADKRIIVVEHRESLGLPKSLNEGISLAKGEYIARMDSDDISLKDRFMTQIKYMEKNPDIDICSTMTKNFGLSKKINSNWFSDFEGVKVQLFLYNCLAHPAIMIRKSFIEKNNIRYSEDFRYSQDYELWSRCCKIGKLSIINKICLLYRIHSKQISTAKIDEQNALCRVIYERKLDELGIQKNARNIKYMFYLSNRDNGCYNCDELVVFIDEIIAQNRLTKIYDEKKLKKFLYVNLLLVYLKKNHKLLPLKYGFKNNLIILLLKKVVLDSFYRMNWIARRKMFSIIM